MLSHPSVELRLLLVHNHLEAAIVQSLIELVDGCVDVIGCTESDRLEVLIRCSRAGSDLVGNSRRIIGEAGSDRFNRFVGCFFILIPDINRVACPCMTGCLVGSSRSRCDNRR